MSHCESDSTAKSAHDSKLNSEKIKSSEKIRVQKEKIINENKKKFEILNHF